MSNMQETQSQKAYPEHCQRIRCTKVRAPVISVIVLLTSVACNFEVINPGPIQDKDVDALEAHAALVNGAGRALSEALNWVAHTGAIVTREQRASGGVIAFGVSPRQDAGVLVSEENNEHWDYSQRARWMADEAVRRIRGAMGSDFSSYELGGRALLWAGYANRLMGENMCTAVIDGGAPEPHVVYFERSQIAFTEALALAREVDDFEGEFAALAGRASVRVSLGDWTGAVADANQVPDDFEFKMRYSSLDLDQYNRIYNSVRNQPYRTLTTWHTPYEDYFEITGDPRTPWGRDPEYPYGDSPRQNIGQVPWYFQMKYTARESPINLSSGSEMRLIEAEALLRQGDWLAAMEVINALRSAVGVAGRTASDLEAAWAYLKRERGIVLWLEGRRLGDIRRWIAERTPGDLDPLEDMTGKDTCFPFSRNEINTNPNIP